MNINFDSQCSFQVDIQIDDKTSLTGCNEFMIKTSCSKALQRGTESKELLILKTQ